MSVESLITHSSLSGMPSSTGGAYLQTGWQFGNATKNHVLKILKRPFPKDANVFAYSN